MLHVPQRRARFERNVDFAAAFNPITVATAAATTDIVVQTAMPEAVAAATLLAWTRGY